MENEQQEIDEIRFQQQNNSDYCTFLMECIKENYKNDPKMLKKFAERDAKTRDLNQKIDQSRQDLLSSQREKLEFELDIRSNDSIYDSKPKKISTRFLLPYQQSFRMQTP